MKILFFGAKSYDIKSFDAYLDKEEYKDLDVVYIEPNLTPQTAMLAAGYEAVCAFVNMDLSAETIDILNTCKVKLILMRCAGFNNVDLERAKGYGMTVTRVPSYSPEAVAEHAMALALTANRHTRPDNPGRPASASALPQWRPFLRPALPSPFHTGRSADCGR